MTVLPSDEARLRRPQVAAGMAAAQQRGVRLGRPPAPLPACADRAAELRGQGLSLAEIAASLAAEQIPTLSGRGRWTKPSVQHLLKRWDEARATGQ